MAGWIEKWKGKFLNSKGVQKAIAITRSIKLPGFEGLSLYQLLLIIGVGLKKGRITNRSAAVSFRILLAIPPLLIVLLTVIPFIPIDNFQENLLDTIARAMPISAFYLFEDTLNDLITKKQETLISISFFMALFFASNAVQAILEGFSHSYHSSKNRGALRQIGVSFLVMLVLSFMVIVGVALITFTDPVLNLLEDYNIRFNDFGHVLIGIVKWLLVILLFEIGISVLYRAGTGNTWRAINAGASFATLGLIIVSSLFAWYVNNFGNYNKLYGSVGTVLVVMFWLYLNVIVLLVGFEINAGLHRANDKVEDLEPEDIIAV